MKPHQERVVAEKAELSEKLDKLEAFHDTSIYAGLPADEQSRLTRQMYVMKLYEQVLAERIAAFATGEASYKPPTDPTGNPFPPKDPPPVGA